MLQSLLCLRSTRFGDGDCDEDDDEDNDIYDDFL